MKWIWFPSTRRSERRIERGAALGTPRQGAKSHARTETLVTRSDDRWPCCHATRSNRPARGLAHRPTWKWSGCARRAPRQEPASKAPLLGFRTDDRWCRCDVRAEWIRGNWQQHGALELVVASSPTLPSRVDHGTRRRYPWTSKTQGERFTFVSNGVVEAENARREPRQIPLPSCGRKLIAWYARRVCWRQFGVGYAFRLGQGPATLVATASTSRASKIPTPFAR